ncbi:MAG TPA: hypothetical protein VF637_08695 [Sphingomicrobium sp.]|jgi:hypothetical protein
MHKIHHKVHTEHLEAVLAYRALLGLGGSFRIASDSDEHRNGEDAQRLSGEAMPARARQGIGGKIVA